VGAGFVASLARPGGNITGLTADPTPEILGKNLELLKEAVPTATRVAFLWNPAFPGAQIYKKSVEDAARRLAMTLHEAKVSGRDEFQAAFAAMVRARAEVLLVAPDPITFVERSQLVQLAEKHRLPAVYTRREFAELGGLISYGASLSQQFRRTAVYLDRILKGAKPGELAVEQPANFEVTINLKTAKALGLTIPLALLLRADRVIE